MSENFVTLIKVKAVKSDGARWIEGWATTSEQDRQNDVVEPRGAKFSLPLPVLFAHDHAAPIGVITEAKVTDKGIRIRARLSAGIARADEVWTLIADGVLTAMSIGFRALERTPLEGGGWRFTSWEWLEASVVAVPACPGAKISVAKCAAMQLKDLSPRTQLVSSNDKAGEASWQKGISTKGGIDPADIWEQATASAKAWVKEHHKAAPGQLPQLAALFAKLAQGLAVSTLGRVIDLERRLARIEAVKNIDGEAFDEMAKCLERLDQLESDFAERSLSFRGFWRNGMTAKRGDAVTDNGSLWIAVRATDEKPANHSIDWCLAARKGKDAG